jgi:hypothetical protein
VDWKRVTTPIPEGVDPGEFKDQAQQDTDQLQGEYGAEGEGEEDDDDLFGPESPKSPGPPSMPGFIAARSITAVCPGSELKHFNDLATANREASRQYLEWHYQFIPGLENEGYRRLYFEEAEEDLKRCADVGHYDRSRSFYREMELDEEEADESQDLAEEYGDGGETDMNHRDGTRRPNDITASRRQKVHEWFRVWVRKAHVHGPGN